MAELKKMRGENIITADLWDDAKPRIGSNSLSTLQIELVQNPEGNYLSIKAVGGRQRLQLVIGASGEAYIDLVGGGIGGGRRR